ncbi:Uncharacterised protein [Vibrio cholerae]|nr:Uncharacterised protein [Vibrio cholerae]
MRQPASSPACSPIPRYQDDTSMFSWHRGIALHACQLQKARLYNPVYEFELIHGLAGFWFGPS